jgi:hypothetical protein
LEESQTHAAKLLQAHSKGETAKTTTKTTTTTTTAAAAEVSSVRPSVLQMMALNVLCHPHE